MARYSRYDQDRASTPGFPRQSDPAGQSAASQGASHRASHAAAGHHAEILDFERISARRGVNEAAQNASFSSFVSTRTRQTVGASASRHHQAEHSAQAVSVDASEAGRSHNSQSQHKVAGVDIRGFFKRFTTGGRDASEDDAAHAGGRARDTQDERTRSGAQSARSGSDKRKSHRLPIHLSFDWLRASRPAQVSTIVCACLILGCAFVYPSAKDAYTAVRNADQAEAEYQAVLNRNDEIQSRIDTLKTDEGIEDLARNSYGYVMSGEHSVRVSGLGDQSIAADAENQTPAIAAGSVAPPETWYSPVLDVVFGYTPDNATTTADDSSDSSDSDQ